jgi:hypothetical protein
MTNPAQTYKDRPILTTEEVDAMIRKAEGLPSKYFVLRAQALVAIAKKFGKRRTEIACLATSDIACVGDDIEFTFRLAKKHKRGLFQYLKEMRALVKKGKADPSILDKPLPQLEVDWKAWQETQAGHSVKNEVSLKSISVNDKYAHYILEYLRFLKANYPRARYLFPSGVTVFGMNYMIDPEKHLSGRQLLRIIKPLNPRAWLHLFRESKGAEIARAAGRNLESVYLVKDGLDLESEESAYHYVRRFAVQKQPLET